MDELDSALVAALQSDGRRSNRDLAQMLGVAPSTTLERVRALRTRGVITGIHASTDMARMGRPVKGMITVRLRPQSREIMQGFRDFVIGLPCSGFAAAQQLCLDDEGMRYVPVAHEGTGMGLCAGAWLGGKRPAALIENLGVTGAIIALGIGTNAYNPIPRRYI